jgi:hypothetical protein
MVKIDMWYGDEVASVTKIRVNFYDCDCKYRGNCYIGGDCVGDFVADDSVELERAFPQFDFNWN